MNFWNKKEVFITGHTGFKGSWLCKVLINAGAEVTGYALKPPTSTNLFKIVNISDGIKSIIGDIRDLECLQMSLNKAKPEFVFHMAAQPIVRDSYKMPVYTYETNVMGTVNILEAVRNCNSVKSVVNVTTDKVYENLEKEAGYVETEKLCGYDPYSNSKSCSELVTYSYKNSFFAYQEAPAISTARSGNVIGGGDFANDRIIPDCVRAASKKENIVVRNPYSVRPYQHVLDSLFGYLTLAQKQYEDKTRFEGSYNFGPEDKDCINTKSLVDLFCSAWGEGLKWERENDNGPHEANCLKLDCKKAQSILGWNYKWDIEDAIRHTVEWSKEYFSGADMAKYMDKQIEEYVR